MLASRDRQFHSRLIQISLTGLLFGRGSRNDILALIAVSRLSAWVVLGMDLPSSALAPYRI